MSAGEYRATSRTFSNAHSCSLQARTLTVLCSWWHRASLVLCSYSTFTIGRRIRTRCRLWWVQDRTTSAVRGIFDTFFGGTEGIVRWYGVRGVLLLGFFHLISSLSRPYPLSPHTDKIRGRLAIVPGGVIQCAYKRWPIVAVPLRNRASGWFFFAEFTQPHLFASNSCLNSLWRGRNFNASAVSS